MHMETTETTTTITTPGYGYRLEIWFCIDQQGRNKAVHFDRHNHIKQIPMKKAKELIAAGYADGPETK